MKIDNIKELEAVLSLCRKKGVTKIDIDGLSIHLGDEPPSNYKRRQETIKEIIQSEDEFEKTLFWSSTGAVNE